MNHKSAAGRQPATTAAKTREKALPAGRGVPASAGAVGESPLSNAPSPFVGGLLRALRWGIVLVFIIMPFHALLTTWVASRTGHFDLVRIWKELLVFAFCLIIGGLVLWRRPVLKTLSQDWVVCLMAVYIVLTLLRFSYGLSAHHVSSSAAIYGLLINARFFGFFILVMAFLKSGGDLRGWRRFILIPAAVVIGFGLLQYALPADFLRHFGYGPHTIPAFQTVDNKAAYVRLQSTLRGPNPLGAYLVMILSLVLAAGLAVRGGQGDKQGRRTSPTRRRWQYALLGLGGLAVLYGTFSRSAWLGTVLAAIVVLGLSIRTRRLRRWALIGGVVLLVLATGSVLALRHDDRFQNVIFHTSNTSKSVSSNAQRAAALENGWRDVWHTPFGHGVGSAGPASVRNTLEPARLSENYFLQIGQETGWLGLGLFVAILVAVGLELYARRSDALALALLAALAGLTFVGFLSHVWADDTLAYLFWGLTAIAIAARPAAVEIPNTKHQKPNKTNLKSV